MRVGYKLWLDSGGKAFGDGPLELLRAVERLGSLRQAAREMGMSYTKAWKLVGLMEERLDVVLLDRSVGGTGGGGSALTPEGRELLARYAAFREEAERLLEELFARHFGGP